MKISPVVLSLVAGVLLSGCASLGGRSAPQRAAAMDTIASSSAQVRPGDRVALKIWNEPLMSDTFQVAESGEVILPKLGAVQVGNQRVEVLQDSLRKAYTAFLRNPSVEISVLRRVGVSGEVHQPGLYLADLTMTLPDIITRAGGLTEAGDPNDIVVLRGSERIRFARADQKSFVVAELRSGDQVIVGQRSFIARNPLVALSSALGLISFFLSQIVPLFK
jgi:protein involved in polysaccharide export with SLBB domain